jgi:hypothetical protein
MSRLICPIKWVPLLALAANAICVLAQEKAPAAEKAAKIAAADSPNAAAMRALRSNADLHLDKVPLADIARLLSMKHKIPIRLDPSGLKRADIDPSRPISAKIAGVPLNTALKQILGPLKLAHCVFNGVILITDRGPGDPLAPFVRARAVRRIINRRAQVVVHQNPFEQNARQLVPDWLMPQLQVELLFVKKAVAPTDDQLREIKRDLKKCLTEASEGPTPPSCDLFPDTLAARVASHLSKEQAARYRIEVEKRKANEREACVFMFIALVDQELDLSDRQRKSLVTALMPKWKPVWSQMIEGAVRDGERAVPPVPDELILPILDSEQAKQWAQLPKNRDVDQRFSALRIGSVGAPVTQPGDE